MEFRKLKCIPIFFLMALTIWACQSGAQSQEGSGYQLMDKTEFNQALDQNESPQLIDVRTPQEFSNGSIEGAINYNVLDGSLEQAMSSLDKEKTVYVYCAKGGRSKKASDLLLENGFTSVVDLKGGYSGWTKE